VGFADFVGLAGVVQNPFACCGFSRINVSHYSDIAGVFERYFSLNSCSHLILPLEMSERFVSFRHFMGIVTLFARATLSFQRIKNLVRKTFTHGFLAPFS
jgi:hypothetical protein